MNYLDWALGISKANPNFNQAVFPNIGLPSDPSDYNYQMGYLNDPGGQLAGNGHLSDIGKLPNHPTFSNESVYAIGNQNVGRWHEPLHGDNWRYSNPSRGLFMVPEAEAYKQQIPGMLQALNKVQQKYRNPRIMELRGF